MDKRQIHSHAMRMFEEWCSKNKIQAYAPDAFHRCTKECSFFPIKRTLLYPHDTFVCKHSKLVHECGPDCTRQVMSPNNEGTHCELTGLCSKQPLLQFYHSYDKTTGRQTSQNSFSTTHAKARTSAQKEEERWASCKAAIETTFEELFWGERRKKQVVRRAQLSP